MIPLAESSSLSLVFTGYVWWLIVPAALAAAFLIVRLYARETAGLDARGWWLRGLRGAVVTILVLLLSQPVLHRVTAKVEPPVIVVLRDHSSSMAVSDTHEPREKRIRAAAALGLIDAKLRNLNASEAHAALLGAQEAVETASGGVRQGLQYLQESADGAGVQDRLMHARRQLATATAAIRKAAESLGAVPNTNPQNKQSILRAADTSAAIDKELGELPARSGDARKHLLDRAQSLKALKQELTRLASEAQKEQDRVDRALAEEPKGPIKDALEKLAKMDRFALTTALLDKATRESSAARARIVTYNIDTDLRSPDSAPLEGDKAGAASSARNASGRRSDTDLATPLLKVAERHAHDSLAAVVLCSDGRHTSGPVPEDAARAVSARSIPVYTLGVGSVDAPPDICVARLEGSSSVFLEETIRLTAHIKTIGFKDAKLKVTLKRDQKVLQQREVTAPADGWLRETFELLADTSGANAFNVSVEPLAGEALRDNNSADLVVDVANDRLKVLSIDELPRWETRYVASLLRRERKMELKERWLITGDKLGARPRALPEEQKALEEFDIVVLGDVPPERLDEAAQRRLARYVADAGGFLVILAGNKAMPRSYPVGPLADLLPVQQSSLLSATGNLGGDLSGGGRVKLHPDAARNEMIRVLRDPALNEQLWTALPELPWIARPAFAKPGATALLISDDTRKDAVVAVHSYGAGRVLYIGTDQTWRWRYKVADRVHAVFWAQAMRWGTSNRLTGGARLKAGLDRRQIRPGESVEVLARARNEDGQAATNVTVTAELSDGVRTQLVQLQPVPDSGGLHRGVLQNVGPGIHTIKVKVSGAGTGVEEALQVISRETTGQEGVELSRDTARLSAIAQAGGGRSLDIMDAPQLFGELAGQSKERQYEESTELWSSWWALLTVVGLLASEWLLRKRSGLV